MTEPNANTTNRLIHERSPYLLQHAHNPVDWYSWGEEAFSKAKKEEKPIFLSIGYSTCHWCHVMEEESFSDSGVAKILNENFVSIKVDREERPDVDQLYMQALMAMTGQGGWPANLFLTPELKPFYGGTYFPPEDRWGRPGIKTVLKGIADSWRNRRPELLKAGQELTQALQTESAAAVEGSAPLTPELLKLAYRQFSAMYDETYGGFEPAPKFPRSHALSFLLRYGQRNNDPQAFRMVERTLQGMAAGGMYDHLGGGFHRYSTDAQWHVPHFEKMLYDQALLAKTCLEAYQATGQDSYAATAREIFEYLLRDMSAKEGGFFSAEDADSAADWAHPEEKSEGAFYLWTLGQFEQLLGADRMKIVATLYGVEPDGNAASDPQGEFRGKNILYRAHTPEEAAKEFQRPLEEIQRTLSESKGILLTARSKRPRPHLDDKILVDWNGLMISSLAFGSRLLEEPRYLQAAKRAADFILQEMVRKDGRLLHRYREGEAGILGTLEDYAFLIHGLVDLYEASFEPRYLSEAKRLTGEMVRLFWDERKGGFFLTGTDAERLIVRQKELYDGAIPSGNSVAALDLIRVGRLTMEAELEKKAQLLMESFAMELLNNPHAYPQLLIALDFALGPSIEIGIASAEAQVPEAMVRSIYRRFLPNKVVAFHTAGEAGKEIEALVPFLKGQAALEGRPTVYVCRNYVCNLPATTVERLEELLQP